MKQPPALGLIEQPSALPAGAQRIKVLAVARDIVTMPRLIGANMPHCYGLECKIHAFNTINELATAAGLGKSQVDPFIQGQIVIYWPQHAAANETFTLVLDNANPKVYT